MKNKILVLILTLVISSFVAGVCRAENSPLQIILGADWLFTHENEIILEQKINVLDKKLELTKDQISQATEISHEAAKKLNIYIVQFIQAKNKLIELKKSNAPAAQIQEQVNKVRALKKRLTLTRRNNVQAFEKILTESQQKLLDDFDKDYTTLRQSEIRTKRGINSVIDRQDALLELQ